MKKRSSRFLSSPVYLLAALPLAVNCAATTAGEEPVGASAEDLFASRDKLWPGGNVTLCWNTAGYATEKRWVEETVDRTWAAAANVHFILNASCGTGLPITVKDDGRAPHSSGLGTDAGGLALNFTFNTWSTACAAASNRENCIRAIAAHEFGHILGFAHEQNRPDAPTWCRDQAQGTNGTWLTTVYDPNSIMNYCNPIWNNGGAMSQFDTQGVQYLYGPSPTLDLSTLWHGAGALTAGGFWKAGGNIAAVSRTSTVIDTFAIGVEGAMWNAAWWGPDNNYYQWKNPYRISAKSLFVPGGGVAAAAQQSDVLDTFTVASDGALWDGGWWAAGLNGGQWNAPYRIGAIAPRVYRRFLRRIETSMPTLWS